jgi:hypothetical protein
MKEWTLRHVVRFSAAVAAGAPVAVALLDSLPWKSAATLSAAVLVASEVAQRVENAKTLRAYWTTPGE